MPSQEGPYPLDPGVGGHDVGIIADSHQRYEVKEPINLGDLYFGVDGAYGEENCYEGHLPSDVVGPFILGGDLLLVKSSEEFLVIGLRGTTPGLPQGSY